MSERFKDILFAILRPDFWVMNDRYSEDWDQFLRGAMDRGAHVSVVSSGYQASIEGVGVWVKNYPYGYGTPHDLHGKSAVTLPCNIRPARRTIYRLHKYICAVPGYESSISEKLRPICAKIDEKYYERLDKEVG